MTMVGGELASSETAITLIPEVVSPGETTAAASQGLFCEMLLQDRQHREEVTTQLWTEQLVAQGESMGWFRVGGIACRAAATLAAHQDQLAVVAARYGELTEATLPSQKRVQQEVVAQAMLDSRTTRAACLEGFREANIAIAQQMVAAATGRQDFMGWQMQGQLENAAERLAGAVQTKHDTARFHYLRSQPTRR